MEGDGKIDAVLRKGGKIENVRFADAVAADAAGDLLRGIDVAAGMSNAVIEGEGDGNGDVTAGDLRIDHKAGEVALLPEEGGGAQGAARGKIKVELGIARGKAYEDKRETLRKRQEDLELRREYKVR